MTLKKSVRLEDMSERYSQLSYKDSETKRKLVSLSGSSVGPEITKRLDKCIAWIFDNYIHRPDFSLRAITYINYILTAGVSSTNFSFDNENKFLMSPAAFNCWCSDEEIAEYDRIELTSGDIIWPDESSKDDDTYSCSAFMQLHSILSRDEEALSTTSATESTSDDNLDAVSWTPDEIKNNSTLADIQVAVEENVPEVNNNATQGHRMSAAPVQKYDKCSDFQSDTKIVRKPLMPGIDNIYVEHHPNEPTRKEDLSLLPWPAPKIYPPSEKMWMPPQHAPEPTSPDILAFYKSYPAVPECQRDITLTTEASEMTERDFMKLYPNCLIKVRGADMYKDIDGVENHPILGNIIEVEGFTRNQIIDSIVKYPHIPPNVERLSDYKYGVQGAHKTLFWGQIEIDGELQSLLDVWDTLPDIKRLPKTLSYIREYQWRRYLLERDVKGIQHNYPIFGHIHPFMTLFAPANTYAELGYTGALDLAENCVFARVEWFRSRNPKLRRMGQYQRCYN